MHETISRIDVYILIISWV